MHRLCCFARLPLMNLVTALLFTLSAGASAQQHSTSASAYYENAVEYYNAEKYDEAVVELKNALQQDPRLLSAILLLGEAYLKTANFAAAESALRAAEDAGADISLVALSLAKAYIYQHKHDLLLAQVIPENLPKSIAGELHTIRARAALEINDRQALKRELSKAEALAPDSLEFLFLKVTLALQDSDIDTAELIVRKLQQLHPGAEKSLLAEASTQHSRGNHLAALEGYGKVLQISPGNTDARIARVGLLFELERFAESETDLTELFRTSNADPRVNYLRSIFFEHARDIQGQRLALAKAQKTIDQLGNDVVLRNQQYSLIAGMANFKLGNDELTLSYLENYVAIGGKDPSARLALAKTYAATGNHLGTINIAEKLLTESRVNVELVKLITHAYHETNQHTKAVHLLEFITTQMDYSAALNLQLALSRIEAGFTEQGIAELEALYINKDSRSYTSLPLLLTLLDHNHFKRAREIANELLVSSPQENVYLNLLALAEVGLGNLDKARASFYRMLTNNPADLTAKINLAKLDMREGRKSKAITDLLKLQSESPQDEQLMLALSKAHRANGNHRDALKWARDANELQQDVIIQQNLIELLLATGSLKEAKTLVFEMEQRNPQSLKLLEIQANVFKSAGELNQLRSHLRTMTDLARVNPEWMVKIARYQIDANALEDASYTLFKVLQDHPDHLPAATLLVEVEIKLNRILSATDKARKLIKQHPQQATGYLLLGDALAAEKNFGEAVHNYELAIHREPKTTTIIRLYTAQRNAKMDDAAQSTLTNWIADYPQDSAIRTILAEHYQASGRHSAAKTEYLTLLAENPDNPRLLNNLANTLLKLHEYDTALQYAERAHGIAPDNPFVNDTLGWLLTLRDQQQRGIAYLREAVTRASTNPEIRYHLAVSLTRLDRNIEAVNELKIALSPNIDFEGRAAAEELLQMLNKQ